VGLFFNLDPLSVGTTEGFNVEMIRIVDE
jgi:hypothetical protein